MAEQNEGGLSPESIPAELGQQIERLHRARVAHAETQATMKALTEAFETLHQKQIEARGDAAMEVSQATERVRSLALWLHAADGDLPAGVKIVQKKFAEISDPAATIAWAMAHDLPEMLDASVKVLSLAETGVIVVPGVVLGSNPAAQIDADLTKALKAKKAPAEVAHV